MRVELRKAMVRDPLRDAEIEVVCPRCGYRMARTPDRLRRGTAIVCPECGYEIAPGGSDEEQDDLRRALEPPSASRRLTIS